MYLINSRTHNEMTSLLTSPLPLFKMKIKIAVEISSPPSFLSFPSTSLSAFHTVQTEIIWSLNWLYVMPLSSNTMSVLHSPDCKEWRNWSLPKYINEISKHAELQASTLNTDLPLIFAAELYHGIKSITNLSLKGNKMAWEVIFQRTVGTLPKSPSLENRLYLLLIWEDKDCLTEQKCWVGVRWNC